MAESDKTRELAHLLGKAARAHHEAIGGPNPGWPEWYARQLVGEIDEHVGFSPSVDEIAEWLRTADSRQRQEDPDGHWPSFYAALILDELAAESG